MDYRKKIFSDIIPPSNLATFQKIKEPRKEKREERKETPIPIHTYTPQRSSRWQSKRKIFGILILIFVSIGLAFWGIRYFATMKVVIQPKESLFTTERKITIMVPAEIITLPLSKEREFITTTRKIVNQKASGIIKVYNEFSSDPQPIIASTRFETPDGKIYRIAENVIIPGAKIEEGKVIPSTIELRVFADRTGNDYNIKDLVNFTIPGFKGGAKYKKIYAQSKTPMEGGLKDEIMVVGDADAENAGTILIEELENELRKNLSKAIPEGFFVPENGETIAIKPVTLIPERGAKADNFLAKVSGEIRTYGVKKSDAAQILAPKLQENGIDLEKNNVSLGRYEKIEFLGAAGDQVTLGIGGEITLIFSPKLPILKDILMSTTVTTLNEVFQKFESIESARVFFSPSWWRKIPTNPEALFVEVDFSK